ncbi:hypothetical protein [Bacillus salipaludis]|uniref:Uncharacterized protein n=1 Tax=Bacillus salipaludis TaxID=2547811 RepID=A0ABW8RNW3_9BACI
MKKREVIVKVGVKTIRIIMEIRRELEDFYPIKDEEFWNEISEMILDYSKDIMEICFQENEDKLK